MIAVVLQSRLDSSRLPRKALLDLEGKPVVQRVMDALLGIPADQYVLACDEGSVDTFRPLALESGFSCIPGSHDNVLERYCRVIRETGASIVVRATGDNPYVCIPAATYALSRFKDFLLSNTPADYLTLTNMPYGSGVEIFSADKLVDAGMNTDSPYDREHVGPALYRHQDRYTCVFEDSRGCWGDPSVRLTIDTYDDYERARSIAARLVTQGYSFPAPPQAILEAWAWVEKPILLCPAPYPGSGHLRRMEALAYDLHHSRRILVWIAKREDRKRWSESLASLLIDSLPIKAGLVVLDPFRSSLRDVERFRSIGPVVSIDDGGEGKAKVDYLIEILPSLRRGTLVNDVNPSLLALPRNRRSVIAQDIRTCLVCAGGDNAASLALPAAHWISRAGYSVTVIDPALSNTSQNPDQARQSPMSIPPVANLKENLANYDLVVTHYGCTAFEAVAAGCTVLLFSPTHYHYMLAKKAGFAVLSPLQSRMLSFPFLFQPRLSCFVRRALESRLSDIDLSSGTTLGSEIERLWHARQLSCPLCAHSGNERPIHRDRDRTIVRCSRCSLLYTSFIASLPPKYGRDYFFDEYKNQYGRTYLEDFDSIKRAGYARLDRIESCVARSLPHLEATEKKLLDIGCAWGPFLQAALDRHWIPCGTDISCDAVSYVQQTLGIQAVCASFPALDSSKIPVAPPFASCTLWYVIEHFEDVESVLHTVRNLLIPGGILAFSTPSARGISARKDRHSFLSQSPLDHYTIWDPSSVHAQLARHGFTVVRTVSTGHHPERFPLCSAIKRHGVVWKFLEQISRLFSLGDTFEVYAVRNGRIEDLG